MVYTHDCDNSEDTTTTFYLGNNTPFACEKKEELEFIEREYYEPVLNIPAHARQPHQSMTARNLGAAVRGRR